MTGTAGYSEVQTFDEVTTLLVMAREVEIQQLRQRLASQSALVEWGGAPNARMAKRENGEFAVGLSLFIRQAEPSFVKYSLMEQIWIFSSH